MQNSGYEMPPIPDCFSHLVTAVERDSYINNTKQFHSPGSNTPGVNCSSTSDTAQDRDDANSPKVPLNGIHNSLTVRKYHEDMDSDALNQQFASSLTVKINALDINHDKTGFRNDGKSLKDGDERLEKVQPLAKDTLNLKPFGKKTDKNDPQSRFRNLNLSFSKLQEEMVILFL